MSDGVNMRRVIERSRQRRWLVGQAMLVAKLASIDGDRTAASEAFEFALGVLNHPGALSDARALEDFLERLQADAGPRP